MVVCPISHRWIPYLKSNSWLISTKYKYGVHVVVQFYPWFNFIFLCSFLCKYMIMNIKQEENKNWTKDKIELQHTCLHNLIAWFQKIALQPPHPTPAMDGLLVWVPNPTPLQIPIIIHGVGLDISETTNCTLGLLLTMNKSGPQSCKLLALPVTVYLLKKVFGRDWDTFELSHDKKKWRILHLLDSCFY